MRTEYAFLMEDISKRYNLTYNLLSEISGSSVNRLYALLNKSELKEEEAIRIDQSLRELYGDETVERTFGRIGPTSPEYQGKLMEFKLKHSYGVKALDYKLNLSTGYISRIRHNLGPDERYSTLVKVYELMEREVSNWKAPIPRHSLDLIYQITIGVNNLISNYGVTTKRLAGVLGISSDTYTIRLNNKTLTKLDQIRLEEYLSRSMGGEHLQEALGGVERGSDEYYRALKKAPSLLTLSQKEIGNRLGFSVINIKKGLHKRPVSELEEMLDKLKSKGDHL